MNNSVQIPLYRRVGNRSSGPDVKIAETTVDTEDAEELQKHRWRLSANNYAYRWATLGHHRSRILMQRLIMGIAQKGNVLEVDHMNLDKLDNRKANLRVLTKAQSHQNMPSQKGSTSKYRGVSWRKSRRKWVAQAKVNKHQYFLGHYEDEEEAARVAAEWRAANMPYSRN